MEKKGRPRGTHLDQGRPAPSTASQGGPDFDACEEASHPFCHPNGVEAWPGAVVARVRLQGQGPLGAESPRGPPRVPRGILPWTAQGGARQGQAGAKADVGFPPAMPQLGGGVDSGLSERMCHCATCPKHTVA